MPKVGKKHYPYTEEGMEMAKTAAKQSGKSVQMNEKGKKFLKALKGKKKGKG